MLRVIVITIISMFFDSIKCQFISSPSEIPYFFKISLGIIAALDLFIVNIFPIISLPWNFYDFKLFIRYDGKNNIDIRVCLS